MTHDTPGDTTERRVWCENCELSVVPETEGDDATCPACGCAL